ncbi:MAG: addiction module antidote protein [Myxococcota bacterium]
MNARWGHEERETTQELFTADDDRARAVLPRALARAKGMTQVARDAHVSRESLYKALSGERSPDFDTILKVLDALGLKLHAEPARG